MSLSFMRLLSLVAVAVLIGACTGTSPTPSPEPASAAPPTPSATHTPGAMVTPGMTAKPTAATVKVLPGEPWIVYEWGVPEADSVGNMIIRPDGTDNHWATPEAPISSGPNGGEGWQLHPDWSPDGAQLTFVIDDSPNGRRDVWVSNADGSDAHRLFDCVIPCDSAEYPAWSKDGQSIMFVRVDHADRMSDGSLLQSVDVTTGEVTTLAATTGADYLAYPRWSPDGKEIVAQVDSWTNITEDSTLDHTSIVVIDLQSSPPTIATITEPEEWANYPDWHPTEDLIVYSRRRLGNLDPNQNDLHIMASDGSDPTLLIDYGDDRQRFLNATQPSWMPDGSGITFVRVEGDDYGTASMWAVDADGSNLRSFPDGPFGGSHPRLRPLP